MRAAEMALYRRRNIARSASSSAIRRGIARHGQQAISRMPRFLSACAYFGAHYHHQPAQNTPARQDEDDAVNW